MKTVRDARVGDTIWRHEKYGNKTDLISPSGLPGYKTVTPYVFAECFVWR